jgi:hypothetical protein
VSKAIIRGTDPKHSAVAPTTLGKIVGANVYRQTTSMIYDGVADAGYSRWIEPAIYSPSTPVGGLNVTPGFSGGSRK